MKNENVEIKIKPRKVWTALLLSILILGLGQIYNGQPKKLWLLFVGIFIIPIVFAVTKLLTTSYGYIILIIILIGIQLYLIIDACISAKLRSNYIPKKYNKNFVYFIYCSAFVLFILFKPLSSIIKDYSVMFKIPTTSNEPTIQEDDYVIADMRAYKKSDPDYGDIVIFKIDTIHYLFRVIGKPNDMLSIKGDCLVINDKQVNTSFIKTTKIKRYQHNEYEETLPNGHKHLIYQYPRTQDTEMEDVYELIVPNNGYFLMGDNRDNARDSRYLGYINREQIIGKATYILYGKSFDRMNINLNKK